MLRNLWCSGPASSVKSSNPFFFKTCWGVKSKKKKKRGPVLGTWLIWTKKKRREGEAEKLNYRWTKKSEHETIDVGREKRFRKGNKIMCVSGQHPVINLPFFFTFIFWRGCLRYALRHVTNFVSIALIKNALPFFLRTTLRPNQTTLSKMTIKYI